MEESWVAPLTAGDPETAWDRFIGRYRRLIFSAIRRYTAEHDEVMDVFAGVCAALRADDFARLRGCAARIEPGRPISTWLVAVVHNLTIDWFRHRDGRPRPSALAEVLPPLRRRIFEYVFVQHWSHTEAFELLRSRDGATLSFGEFRKELTATYRTVAAARGGQRVVSLAAPEPETADHEGDEAMQAERQVILAHVLAQLAPEDRLAVQLYVVEGVPAADVARALGLAGAKAVYNRVYRALAALRERLEQQGLKGGDL
jgi:RNA polymerase sigma factor (sigma-70 family)